MGIAAQSSGKAFEAKVAFMAQRERLLLVRHGCQTRYLRGGRTVSVYSDVDFRVCDTSGRLAFFDAKSFAGGTCPMSLLPERQRALVALYALHRLVSGFVVEMRGAGCVTFFSAAVLKRLTRGTGLRPCDGLSLGTPSLFSLNRILTS